MKCFINGRPVRLQSTAVMTPPYHTVTKNHFVLCPMEGPLEVTVICDKSVTEAVVRPLSAGIVPTVSGHTVRFTLPRPINVSVEPDGDLAAAVQVFPIIPRAQNFAGFDHVSYFACGQHDVDELRLTEDNTAVYLAEGAVVHGRIFAEGVRNLKIFGPGILTMQRYHRILPEERSRCVEIKNCTHVTIEDICVLDSCNWSMRLNESRDISIDNVKIIGCRGNSDGIDVTGSSHVRVRRCFIRTYDDSFVVKSLFGGDVEDVVFEESTLWNDMARPIEVGVEMRCAHVRDVTFRNIDVIHSLTCYPIFGIHHGDRATVSDIRFEDIRIEHAPGAQLFDFRITDSVWNKDTQKGVIRNITVDRIALVGQEGRDFRTVTCRMEGFSPDHDIRGVHIGRITAFGKPLSGARALGLRTNAFVQGVTHDGGETPMLRCTIREAEPFALREYGSYYGVLELEIHNPTSEIAEGTASIRVFPRDKHGCEETPVQFRLAPGETATRRYGVLAQPGKLAAETRCSRIDCVPDVYYRELDYVLPATTARAPRVLFSTLYGHRDDAVRFALRNGWLEIQAEAMLHHDLQLYAAQPPAERADNEVLFSVEESYFGEGPSLKWKDGALCPAPEIGNHLEITYVFLNQPKVGEIRTLRLPRNLEGIVRIPADSLPWSPDGKEIWLELALLKDTGCCKPYTLFRSTLPEGTAHMFGHFRVEDEEQLKNYYSHT